MSWGGGEFVDCGALRTTLLKIGAAGCLGAAGLGKGGGGVAFLRCSLGSGSGGAGGFNMPEDVLCRATIGAKPLPQTSTSPGALGTSSPFINWAADTTDQGSFCAAAAADVALRFSFFFC